MLEKRSSGERVPKFIDLTVEDDALNTLFRAATADISERGMRLVTNRSLPEGANYTFTLRRSPHLILRGQVRWVEQLPNQSFRAGIHFVENAPDVHATLGAFLEAEQRVRPVQGQPS